MPVIKDNPSLSTEILTYHQQGHTVKQCAIHFNIHEETARRHLKKAGVGDLRHQTRLDIDIRQLIEYYQDHTLDECAQKYECGPTAIHKRLKKAGVLRTKKEKAKINSETTSRTWESAEYREKMEGIHQSQEYKRKRSAIHKKLWENPEYRAKVGAGASEGMKRVWEDDEYRENQSQKHQELWEDDEYRENQSQKHQELWEDDEYRKNQLQVHRSDEYVEAASERSRKLWQDPQYREQVIEADKQAWTSEDLRQEASERTKQLWQDDDFRQQISASMAERWQDPEFRARMMAIFRDSEYREMMSHVSAEMWQDKDYHTRMVIIFTEARSDLQYREKMKEIWQDPKLREMLSDKIKKHWQIPGFKEHMSKIMQEVWESPERRQKMSQIITILWQDPEYRQKLITVLSDRAIHLWQDPKYRQRMTQIIIDRWKDPKYKEKMMAILAKHPKVSSIQKILYSILDDLGVKYYREYEEGEAKNTDSECQVGPHSFDCMIPRENRPDLLIECQGDYWHSFNDRVWRDQVKATYIANNLSDQYELKCIWEHEFLNKNKIIELLKYWLGITQLELIDFKFDDVKIQDCAAQDYKLLLSKYHYLPNAGRGGIAYGAYLADELIAVCVFSPLVRQNINVDGYNQSEIRELSRLCIHPHYQKKNFASWFVSRCVKQLGDKFKCIISYCDTTFNHNGAIYKACNFIQDKTVRPDYWYVSSDGWVMHKKTLYNHARQLHTNEAEYAAAHGYSKVYGREKLRFVYKRR